jgi:ELWxxDGT repeat protein
VIAEIPGQTPRGFAVLNGTFFFETNSLIYPTQSNLELWKTDGTSSGTSVVQAFDPRDFISSFFDLNCAVYFIHNSNSGDQSDLWKIDGSDSEAVLVKTFKGSINHPPHLDGVVVFMDNRSLEGEGDDLYKTDGTSDGTVVIKHFTSNQATSHGRFIFEPPDYLTVANGVLFIVTGDGTLGTDLWKSDGTDGGTMLFDTHGKASLNQEVDSQKADRIGAQESIVAQAGKQNGPITSQARVVVCIDAGDAEADLEAFFISDQSARERDSNEVSS